MFAISKTANFLSVLLVLIGLCSFPVLTAVWEKTICSCTCRKDLLSIILEGCVSRYQQTCVLSNHALNETTGYNRVIFSLLESTALPNRLIAGLFLILR